MSSITSSHPFGLGGAWLAQHTLQTVGAGLALFDSDGCLVEIDARAADLLSLHDSSGVGLRLDDARWAAIHLDGRLLDEGSDPIRSALATTSTTVADILGVVHDSGDTRWLATTALPVAGVDGRAHAALASFVEVTGLIRDRVAVELAERIGRSTFDHAALPMCVVDAHGCLRDWNRSFAAMVDRPDFELVMTPFDRWIIGGHGVLDTIDPSETTRSVTVTSTSGRVFSLRCWSFGPDEPADRLVELTPAHIVGPET